MPKFTRETVNAFQEKLGQIDDSWQQELNLRETVFQSYPDIKRARTFKATWEQIADILVDVSHSQDKINPESIRQYYFEISNNPELQDKYRSIVKKSSRKSKSSPTQKSNSKIEAEKSGFPDSNDVDNSQPEVNTSAQFNLSRRGKGG